MTESPERENSTWPINLFDLEWIDLFGLWNKPLPSICNQLKADSALQIKISQCVSARETAIPIYKPKRPVSVTAVEKVDAETKRLQELDISVDSLALHESVAFSLSVKKWV